MKRTLVENGINSVFVAGTPLTIKQNLYKFENIKKLSPNEKEIKEFAKIIFDFNRGIKKKKQKLQIICKKYLKKGAETAILACTEFAVMLDKENIPKINTIDILVESTINKILKQKGVVV